MLSGLPEVTQLAGKRSRIKELQVWAPGRNGELLCLNKHSPKGRDLGWLILGRCFNFSSSRKRTNPEHWVTAAAAQDEQGTAGGNNRGFIFTSFLRSYLKLGMCKGGGGRRPVARERKEQVAGRIPVRQACWAEGFCAELVASGDSLGLITYKVGAPCPELHGGGVRMALGPKEIGSVSQGAPSRKSLPGCRRTRRLELRTKMNQSMCLTYCELHPSKPIISWMYHKSEMHLIPLPNIIA